MVQKLSEVRCILTAYGDVQQVGYRYAVQEVARRLGLKGYVQNKPDGSVLIVAEGPKEKLERLAQAVWIREDPINVDKVEAKYEKATGEFKFFQIRVGDFVGEVVEGFGTAWKYARRMSQRLDSIDQRLESMDRGLKRLDRRYRDMARALKSLAGDFRKLVGFVEEFLRRRSSKTA
jgi:acylphosphatase